MIQAEVDDTAWRERCSHWASRRQSSNRRPIRQRERTALFLVGHGVSLRIDTGALLIRNGFTHYPQIRETYRFFRGDLSLPSRIILLDGTGTISLDVLSWLAEQGLPLIRIDWQGHVQTVLANAGYAANPHRLAWQVEARADPRKRMAFCIDLIARKIEASILTLEKSIRRSPAWERAMERAYADLTRLECDPPQDVVSLRALEAGCAAAYFRAWRAVPLKWIGTSRKPIPASWKTIGPRTTLFRLAGNRHAAHPVNAMLNYAYAILESQARIQLVADGLDPTQGIMHETREGSSAFVYDMMEPERPKVDRAVLEFVKANALHPADFTIRTDGVCRLNPEMARTLALGLAHHLGPRLLEPRICVSGGAGCGSD
ncbi:CRISPR-associated endonuclease Cas1 [Rhizobiales bacterium GAS191]|nr:CRISPR-associated endonuclease Cas1 [Rhizobiales bacterium GAS191]